MVNPAVEINLNGDPFEIAAGATVAALVEKLGLAGRRIAVEINQAIVPRGLHGEHQLKAGDQVEIIHAIGGG